MKISKVAVRQGEMQPPWYYGRAYSDFCTLADVYLPIPANFFARAWRWLCVRWNRWRGRRSQYDVRVLTLCRRHGQRRFQAGYEYGVSKATERFMAMIQSPVLDEALKKARKEPLTVERDMGVLDGG